VRTGRAGDLAAAKTHNPGGLGLGSYVVRSLDFRLIVVIVCKLMLRRTGGKAPTVEVEATEMCVVVAAAVVVPTRDGTSDWCLCRESCPPESGSGR
jgi:hypothetical protein